LAASGHLIVKGTAFPYCNILNALGYSNWKTHNQLNHILIDVRWNFRSIKHFLTDINELKNNKRLNKSDWVHCFPGLTLKTLLHLDLY
jgi:hypothetical protein